MEMMMLGERRDTNHTPAGDEPLASEEPDAQNGNEDEFPSGPA